MSDFQGGRPCRLRSSRYAKARDSNSPTLSSTQSEKSLWARSYKNQPIPKQIRSRMLGRKYRFVDSSDQDQQIIAVLEQEQHQHNQKNNQKKKTRLSKFKVISDYGEFSDSRRSRLNSQRKSNHSPQRCHSVSSLKLPQVLQEKREDDQLRRRGLSKLAEFRDNNQFGQNIKGRRSCSQISQSAQRTQNILQLPAQMARHLPEQILQNEAQQTKSVKLTNQKSIITAELQKLIVDEIDQKRRKKQEITNQQIQSIIQQQKPQQQVDTHKLSQLLSKFESESSYLNKLNDQEDFSRKIQNQSQAKSQKNLQKQI